MPMQGRIWSSTGRSSSRSMDRTMTLQIQHDQHKAWQVVQSIVARCRQFSGVSSSKSVGL